MARLLAPLLFVVLLPAAAPARSETWPAPADLFVNDLAGIIEEPAEARLRASLAGLKAETGVEMTVLTIGARDDYVQGETIEGFATTLFNRWGVGDATRNDGILVLVARDDREMRIALGSGYSLDWDRVAQEVIDDSFLPSFREDRYSDGIETGTEATIARIARPHAAGASAPRAAGGGGLAAILAPVGFVGLFLALMFRRKLGDLGQRARRCPQCGHRGLERTRHVLQAATRETTGREETLTACPNCNWRMRDTHTIPRRGEATSSSGDFGGGSSSGGGASGRW